MHWHTVSADVSIKTMLHASMANWRRLPIVLRMDNSVTMTTISVLSANPLRLSSACGMILSFRKAKRFAMATHWKRVRAIPNWMQAQIAPTSILRVLFAISIRAAKRGHVANMAISPQTKSLATLKAQTRRNASMVNSSISRVQTHVPDEKMPRPSVYLRVPPRNATFYANPVMPMSTENAKP